MDIGKIIISCQKNNFAWIPPAYDRLCQFNSTHSWHLNIRNHNICHIFFQALQCPSAIACGKYSGNPVLFPVNIIPQCLQFNFFIFYKKNAIHFLPPVSSCSCSFLLLLLFISVFLLQKFNHIRLIRL